MLQKWLSQFLGKLASSTRPKLKNFLISSFIKLYKVDLKEAALEDYRQYPSFNAFFARTLKKEARFIVQNPNDFLSPVDGVLYQWGEIRDNTLINAKGKSFNLTDLLGKNDNKNSDFFSFGCFYLSPRDYHRVHLPVAGVLKRMTYIPGTFFSVNPRLTDYYPNIFAKNERVIAYFDTAWGELAMVLVGAFGVGSIKMKWNPELSGKVIDFVYDGMNFSFEQGEEIGYFEFGSTVIVLLPKILQTGLKVGTHVKMGQKVNV